MRLLYQEIDMIRERPGMYLGEMSITRLRSYLDGFQGAVYRLCHDEESRTLLPLPFWFFHEYVARHFGRNSSVAGWRNIILEHTEGDEAEGLAVFFQLFDAFKALAIERCDVATIDEHSRVYHYTDPHAPHRIVMVEDVKERMPVFIDPLEVYRIKLSGAGIVCLIHTEKRCVFAWRIYQTEEEAQTYLHTCFGEGLKWTTMRVDNLVFDKPIEM